MSESMFSEVKVFLPKTNTRSSLLARGTFVIAESLKVNFSYVNGKNGPFVSLPQDKVQKDGETKYYPHANFITKPAVAELSAKVKEVYEEAQGKAQADTPVQADAPADDDLPF